MAVYLAWDNSVHYHITTHMNSLIWSDLSSHWVFTTSRLLQGWNTLGWHYSTQYLLRKYSTWACCDSFLSTIISSAPQNILPVAERYCREYHNTAIAVYPKCGKRRRPTTCRPICAIAYVLIEPFLCALRTPVNLTKLFFRRPDIPSRDTSSAAVDRHLGGGTVSQYSQLMFRRCPQLT